MMMDAVVMAEPTLPGIYIIYDLDLGLISHFWKFGFMLQRRLFGYLKVGWVAYLKGLCGQDADQVGRYVSERSTTVVERLHPTARAPFHQQGNEGAQDSR